MPTTFSAAIRRSAAAFFVVLFVFVTSGCGNKGPLYLPDTEQSAPRQSAQP